MIFDFFRVTILNFQIYDRGFQRKRILKRNLKRSADSTYKPVAKLYTPSSPGIIDDVWVDITLGRNKSYIFNAVYFKICTALAIDIGASKL